MKLKRQRFTKKFLLVVLVLVAALGALAYFAYTHQPKDSMKQPASSSTPSENTIDYSPSTEPQKNTGNNQKQETVDKDQNPQPQPSELSVTITAADQNGSILSIRTLVGTITSSGTCTLTLTKDSVTVTKTSGIQALASSSTCQGFDIPTAELSPGEWQTRLDVSANNLTGHASKSVIVN